MFRLYIVFTKERMKWGVMPFSLLEMYQCLWVTFCLKKKSAGPSEMLVNFCLTVLCHVAEHSVRTHSLCWVCFVLHIVCLTDCISILNYCLRYREQHIIWALKGGNQWDTHITWPHGCICWSFYEATRCVLYWNEEGNLNWNSCPTVASDPIKTVCVQGDTVFWIEYRKQVLIAGWIPTQQWNVCVGTYGHFSSHSPELECG